MTTTQSREAMPEIAPYPAELAARYRDAGYWGPRTIADEFSATAALHPDRAALVGVDGCWTYAELDRRSDSIAIGLRDLGLRPGERVLLQTTNRNWAVLAWYGLLKAGLVPVATLAQHRIHELSQVAAQTEPAAHLVQADFPSQDLVALARQVRERQPSLRVLLTINADPVREDGVALESLVGPDDTVAARAAVAQIQRGIAPDGLAVMQLSGGTTSVPKVIPRLHGEYWYNARAYAQAIGLDENGAVAHVLPVVHNAGIVCGLHAAHAVGACLALSMPTADEMKRLARSVQVTHGLIPPPIAKLILGDPELRDAMSTLKTAVWVLGHVTDEIVEAFEKDACRIVQMFGMAEGLCLVTPRDAPAKIRHTAVGTRICPDDEIRIYAPGTEDEVPPGTRGELCCRGPYTIRGYYGAPERNAEAFTADGFYRTGDIVIELEHDGSSYYVLEDRIKDLINRGGEKINAAEVEELLLRHPAIERVAVVAMPDERLGEKACAFVVPAAGADVPTVEDLRGHLDALGVARFKWPERVEARDDLPQTSIKKVNKAQLRQEIAAILAA